MRILKATILSLSLVTVMAGAAVAPALSTIADYFSTADTLLIKLIITLPSLFIIVTSLLFSMISNLLSSKAMSILGLVFYIAGGCGAGLVNNIYLLLVFRSILGIGVGLIMPLSTGLIAYFFDQNEQSKLMGYSFAMNNLGGIIALVLSGVLVSINWRYSFAIYSLGILVLIMSIFFLPKADLSKAKDGLDLKSIRKILPYALTMFATMVIFYTLPSNFSIIISKEQLVPTSFIGLLMSLQNIFAFITGLLLFSIIKKFGKNTKYFATGMLALGFWGLSFTGNILTVIFGLFALGIGLGTLIPILNTQIAINIAKEKMTSAMAIMSAMLFLGQFLSPIIIDTIQSTFHLQGLQIPFCLATILSIALMICLIKIPISHNKNEPI